MKRLSSSDSLGGLMSICPSTEEHSPRNKHVYSRDFQSMLDGLDEEGCLEEPLRVPEKKRRLSVDQVKALEKNFEVENKLEPERKLKLAQELGLQPRQVAVWFQNRRARWKTKQLERDYGVLKANYDSLEQKFEALQQDNEALLKEIGELKSKLNENTESDELSVKEEAFVSETDNQPPIEPPQMASLVGSEQAFKSTQLAVDFKDGPSDSDSSAILNEENSANAAPSSPPGSAPQQQHNHRNNLLVTPFSPTSSSAFRFNCSSSPSPSPSPSSITTYFNLSVSWTGDVILDGGAHKGSSSYDDNQPPFVKMEEHDIFSEEACNFFPEDQAPTLHHWYYAADQWA